MPRSATPAALTARSNGQVVVPVDQVRTDSRWGRRLNRAHVLALTETPDAWPPIVVTGDTRVVDGHHRLAAARELGLLTINAQRFEGTADEAFIEFVRLNTTHGLPLTLTERRDAARVLLEQDGRRSDRWIAELCGLSPNTVGKVRRETIGRHDDHTEAGGVVRVGRDGRARPLHANAVRERIAKELDRRPDASLRSIARVVGASPQTVRSVARSVRVDEPVADPPAPIPIAAFVRTLRPDRDTGTWSVGDDPAFRDDRGAASFAALFDSTSVDRGALFQHVDCIPVSRIYEVADEARRRAESWREFAELLESRVRRRA